jgi:hypothetical protein
VLRRRRLERERRREHVDAGFEVDDSGSDGGRWRRVASMSVPRHGLAVVAEAKRVHLIAGGPQPGFSFSDAHEVLQL